MLVGEGAKLDVHGCKTVDMASSFGKALLEFVFIVFACITLLIGINAAKSKAAGRVLFPATFVTGIASISYFSMASGGGFFRRWIMVPVWMAAIILLPPRGTTGYSLGMGRSSKASTARLYEVASQQQGFFTANK